ncbi:MAG: hypothetical protein J6M14_00115 [Campylobacter sp.]|nr:hypothetical protein [Campylobacter sp.]
MPYYTGSIRLGKLRLGAIFTPEELGKLSKKEEDFKNFIQQVDEKINQIYIDIFKKLGLDLLTSDELEARYSVDAWKFIENEVNLSKLDEISKYLNFVMLEMEKAKFNGGITSAKKEKITDSLFDAQNLIPSLVDENLQIKIFQENPQIEQKIKKIRKKENSKTGRGTILLLFILICVVLALVSQKQ